MNTQDQRIAIATAYGFKEDPHRGWYHSDWRGGDVCIDTELPDYPNDLNAMHEAEKALNSEQYWAYVEWCDKMIGLRFVKYVGDRTSATAAQRAEAFLRTLSLWKD